jgi:hypothetical protein
MSQKFLDWILEEVFDRAHDPESGNIRLSALTQVLLDNLEDAGVLVTPQAAYYRYERGNFAAEVHGYAYDMEEEVISLFSCIDATADVPLGHSASVCSTGKDILDRAFRRMESFVRRAQGSQMEEIEDSQPAHELAELLREAVALNRAIELHVLTTGVVSDRAATARTKGSSRREIWDLTRLERVCGTGRDGAITIDFPAEFETTLPCLITPKSSDGLQVLLTCIPGQLLADIYNSHRSALLERNVRSFLQFTGKVNKGIRATILNEPHRFLPYNNGLSATAGEVELDVQSGGIGQIRVVRDFQIVNGGQTTASIASCSRRDHADLSTVAVPMKLTVVPKGLLDGLVPQISRYANTQNRIQDSDFSANDPWHIGLERLSRATWTRATAETPRGTRWFYERSRGQYSDSLAACQTPAGKRQFRAENPSAQKFTKTDLAKYMLSWDQLPAIVSKGAQKCFTVFMNGLASSQRRTPDEADFRRIISLAILFRSSEKLYGQLGYQGYRAQVVTYSIARLSHECQRYLDVDTIWREQAVPEIITTALKYIIEGVREVIVHPPSNQRNVGEWCKKDDCWTAVLERPILVQVGPIPVGHDGSAFTPATATLSVAQQQAIDGIKRIPCEVWFATSAWAKNVNALQPWQRSLAYSLGRLGAGGKAPTVKQSIQGRRLLLESIRLGFCHEAISNGAIEALRELPDNVD